jgi:hypothetical protein
MEYHNVYAKHDSDNCECCLDFWLGPQTQVRAPLPLPLSPSLLTLSFALYNSQITYHIRLLAFAWRVTIQAREKEELESDTDSGYCSMTQTKELVPVRILSLHYIPVF